MQSQCSQTMRLPLALGAARTASGCLVRRHVKCATSCWPLAGLLPAAPLPLLLLLRLQLVLPATDDVASCARLPKRASSQADTLLAGTCSSTHT
jgi:hypothetical protein